MCQGRVVRSEDACSSRPTLCTLSLGLQFASSASSGHTRRKSAALRRRVTLAPIHAMTAWRSLPPASLTGSAFSLACARATLGTYALHCPRERGRRTTFREFHPQVG